MAVIATKRNVICDHGQRREAIVQRVLAEVFQGRFQAGEHLATEQLAQRFGVSHTPIREALVALSGIGVVDLLPNRGAVVRAVTAQDVRDVCQVRRALECEAARSACGRIELAELRELAEQFRRLLTARRDARLIARARRLDSRLHDLIATSADNEFLANEINRLKMLFRAYRDVSWKRDARRNDSHRLAEEASEHLAIVEALLAGDARLASRAMARHIHSGMKYWSRALPRRRTSQSDVPRRNKRNQS